MPWVWPAGDGAEGAAMRGVMAVGVTEVVFRSERVASKSVVDSEAAAAGVAPVAATAGIAAVDRPGDGTRPRNDRRARPPQRPGCNRHGGGARRRCCARHASVVATSTLVG